MLLNVDRFQRLMDRDGLDGLVATTLENCFYLSGSWSEGLEQHPYDDEAYVVVTRDRPAEAMMALSLGALGQTFEGWIAPSRVIPFGIHYREIDESASLTGDEKWLAAAARGEGVRTSGIDALCDALVAAGLDRAAVGFDERGPNRAIQNQLEERLPGMRVQPAFSLFREIRMVKTEEERNRMLRALAGTEAAIRAVTDEAREGITEMDLFRVAQHAVVSADCLPLWSGIRFGRNAAYGTVSDQTVLHRGDFIWMDLGCTYKGYRSDIGRTVAVGEPSAKLNRYYAACKSGQDLALRTLIPGACIRDVFAGTVDQVRAAGIPEYRRRHVGHGIGIEWYESPRLVPGSEAEIELGAMMEVETPHYELGFGATMLEDLVVVTAQGAELLTSLPRDLMVVG